MKNDEYYIKRTINEAKKCEKTEDIPVGCIIVDKNTGRIVGKAHNKRNKDQIVTQHAEILAIEKVNKKIKSWHLNNYKLYTSLEPCEMCKKVIEISGIEDVCYCAKSDNAKINSKMINYYQVNNPNLISESSNLIKKVFKIIRGKIFPGK